MLSVKLNSDFEDCYDKFFDTDGDTLFSRRSTAGPGAVEMYNLLNMVGLKTPKFGMVAELYKDLASKIAGGKEAIKKTEYDKVVKLVVFTDLRPTADNKILVSLEEARDKYPGHFAAQYIPTGLHTSRTERLLVVGDKHLWMEYVSDTDWRSTRGSVTINELDSRWESMLQIHEVSMPLYAVDFVVAGREKLAINFDVAPAIRGTTAERLMHPEIIADGIKKAVLDMAGIRRW